MNKFRLLTITMLAVIALLMSATVRAEDEVTRKTCQQMYQQVNEQLVKADITSSERSQAIMLRNKGLAECKQGKLEESVKHLQESFNIIMHIQPTVLFFF